MAFDLPVSSGLSSSASIEVVTAFAFNELLAAGYSRLDLVRLAKGVENDFIGVQSGVMDQFAVTFGQKDTALLLNCQTLAFQAVPVVLGGYAIAIIDSNKPRKLAESKYNERVEECGAALQALRVRLNIDHLCEVSSTQLHHLHYLITDVNIRKRVLHVVGENERVTKAAELLKKGDLCGFGKLMDKSHLSLKHLYEVSGKELDTIVAYARSCNGVIGARMTGAGFGGCAIALVKKEVFDTFATAISAFYLKEIGYAPTVYRTAIGHGVGFADGLN